MLLVKTEKELKPSLSVLRKNASIGLVPTMGALHKGHASLVQRALLENDVVVVSIFVNPTQFNNREDLKKYPRNLEADITFLDAFSKDLVIFAPSVAEIYDTGIHAKEYNFGGLDKVMEGAFREDHFNGVGTIVEALLKLIRPDRAYFGEKDFQQLQIIRKLVKTRKIPVEIIGCEIVREHSGLAMSSRNERLSDTLRKEAAVIFETLQTAKKLFGTKSAKYVMGWVKKQFEKQPQLRLEYFEITHADTLKSVKRKHQNTKYRAFVAVYAHDVRLIDNIALN
tara:strand:- start:1191 stop:2036 length:846 start_codon:yes stop_codon:yes gene_type:complete